MVLLIILALAAFAFLLWRNYENSLPPAIGPTVGPAGPIYTPKATPLGETLAIDSIPIVGPLAAYTTNAIGNDIIQDKYLEAHSSVGPNQGQTEASAGVLGVTVPISSKPIYATSGGAEATVFATGGVSLLSSSNRNKVESDLEFWKW
jgi:hypothetical protein